MDIFSKIKWYELQREREKKEREGHKMRDREKYKSLTALSIS